MTGKELSEKMILYRAKHNISGVELAIIRANIKKTAQVIYMDKLTTYADYEAECKRVQKIIDGSTRRNAGQWITYLHRLWKEMQEYRKNKEQAK